MTHRKPSLTMLWITIRLGLDNVRAHKLRSALTVLGIVFGVCSVISMIAIGEGASQEVQDQIRRLGSQNIIIQSLKPPQQPGEQETSRNLMQEYGLTYADAERMAETLPAVRVTVPIKSQRTDLWVGGRKVTVRLVATVPWIMQNQEMRIQRGRFITTLDLERKNNVCVLGAETARKLFQYRDPLGEPIRIGSDVYRVVGIVDDSGQAAGNGNGNGAPGGDLASQGVECFIPITTLRARQGDMMVRRESGSMSAEKVELSELILSVNDLEDVLPTAALVEDLLQRFHPRKDYGLLVPQRLLEEARRTQRIFSIVLSSIAAISLLVGGIGIMNIMLASVSERTREIGVRRALGARRIDIMAQFLVETLILSLGGGMIGMALGAAVPLIVTELAGMRTVLTVWSFVLSFGVSAAVGIIFGLYPARRAAMMDPIEALRSE